MTIDEDDFVKVPPIIASADAPLGYRVPEGFEIPEGWTNVDVYTLDPARLKGFLSIVAWIHVGYGVVFGAILAAGMMWMMRDEPLEVRLAMACLSIVGFMIFQAVNLFREVWRTRRQWAEYRLLVSDQGFLEVSPDVKVLMDGSEVVRIVEEWDSLAIYLTKGRRLRAPKRAERADQLRDRLDRQWGIKKKEGGARMALILLATVGAATATLVVFVTAMASRRAGVVAICMVLHLAFAGWMGWQVLRAPNARVMTKVAAWLAILGGFAYLGVRLMFLLVFG